MSKPVSSTIATDSNVLRSFHPTKNFNYHHSASVTSLDFDDSGQFLLSAGVDRSIQLYDVHKGSHVKDIQSQKYGAHLARFTHSGFNCLYASTTTVQYSDNDLPKSIDSHQLRLLNLENKQYVRYFKGHHSQVISLQINPIEDTFVSASIDGKVKMWDTRATHDIGGIGSEGVQAIGYDPSGKVLALATDRAVKLYDSRNYDAGSFLSVDIAYHPKSLEFSNTGKTILIGGDCGFHQLVDAFSGELLTKFQSSRPGEVSNFVYPSLPVVFSPCGKYVVSSSFQPSQLDIYDLTKLKTTDGGVHTVNYEDNPKVTKPCGSILSPYLAKLLAFDPKLMVLAAADSTVMLWQPNMD
ncbi:COMPASS component Swd2p [Diutina catenulata]